VKRKPGSGRIARKSVEVVELETNETKYFPSLLEASKYYGKTKNYFIYNNGRVWEIRNYCNLSLICYFHKKSLSHSWEREFFC